MVFVCPEKYKQRKTLLSRLKDLVDQIDEKCSPSCCPPCNVPLCPAPCCPPVPCNPTYCGDGPVIEIYDPLPKACLPIVTPVQPCCQSCSPPTCTTPECCLGTCPAPTAPLPICSPPACPVMIPPCLPICTPVPPPCVPVCNPCPEEQPCVPCNPPQMMVCYRRPKHSTPVRRSKSRELRSSVLHVGCDCVKQNGLQDDCPRKECKGSPECLAKPDPTCGPSDYAEGKHLGANKYNFKKNNNLEEYQCYPAYIKLPSSPPYGTFPPCGPCPPYNPWCPPRSVCCPNVPLVAAAPCPPPICPGPPPMIPVGTIIPTVPAMPVCLPPPPPPPLLCCPPYTPSCMPYTPSCTLYPCPPCPC